MLRPSQSLQTKPERRPLVLAATVLLLRDGEEGLEVLISQRAAASSFVPSMYVFPGGRVDAEDQTWLQHWQAVFPTSWPQRTRSQALAAVRECFEEMGVLLAQDAAGNPLGATAQAQLDRSKPLFTQLAERGWQPAVADLAWVCDRLPPASLPKRFHTAFFYAAMPAGQTVRPDMHEQLDAVWLPVRSEDWQGGEGQQRYPMIFPTQEALRELQGFASVAAALQHAAQLEKTPPYQVPHYQAREVLRRGQTERITFTDLAYAEAELRDPSGGNPPVIDWQHDAPVALTRSVQRLTCPNPSMMSGPGTNTYLIGSAAQGFVVLDAGPAIKDHLRRILQATDGRIVALLCTHSHPDHSPGAVLLHRFLRRKGRRVPLMGMASAATAAAHSRFTPTDASTHDKLLQLPARAGAEGMYLRIIHTPGHAANHICVLLEEDGLLFSGDHILSGTTTVIAPPDGNMTDYLQSLERLDGYCQRFDVQFILPAHGHVLGGSANTDASQYARLGQGARRVIAYYRQHRLQREAKIIAAMRQLGVRKNTPEIRQQLLPLVYADAPPALWPVAERSLDAHMARILALRLLAKA